jgi:hypothetical protein
LHDANFVIILKYKKPASGRGLIEVGLKTKCFFAALLCGIQSGVGGRSEDRIVEVVHCLIQHGADIDIQNDHGILNSPILKHGLITVNTNITP